MTEHTPGPWKAEGTCPQEGWDGWWVKDAEGNHIAEATGYQADETRQANAYLIAASPDLLAACEAALELFTEQIRITCGCGFAVPENDDDVMRQLRAAIARASGCER